MSTTPNAVTADASACAVSPASETRLTDTLEVLASGCAGERISVDDLATALGDKCFAGLLFLFAAPNFLPTPPGTDMVVSVPLAILACQLVAGLRRPWLPGWILRREVATARFAKVTERLSPITRRTEKILTRRLPALTGLVGRRVIGLLCLALAIMLALPVPLGNAVPGIAIASFALGLMGRDGLAVLAGMAATLASAAIAAGMGLASWEIGGWLLDQLGG